MNSLETKLAAAASELRARVGLRVNVVVAREVGFDYGEETNRFMIRWGDSIAKDSLWPFSVVTGDTLDQAMEKANAKIAAQGDTHRRMIERLTSDASSLGYVILKKGGSHE